jgi:hypothetical protein
MSSLSTSKKALRIDSARAHARAAQAAVTLAIYNHSSELLNRLKQAQTSLDYAIKILEEKTPNEDQ